jgi:pSer/pThr/pTyr-binding forkhead associated (FHA) protein
MLKNTHSEHSLESLRVPGSVFRIGRNEGSDLRLEHQAFPLLVSRNHAE